LVRIDNETTPNIAKIRDSIKEAYSDDDGDLYFLFAAENRYSAEMDVNDDRTLEKMKEEKRIRETFIKSIILKDAETLSEAEHEIIKKDILPKLVENIVNQNLITENQNERKSAFERFLKTLEEDPLGYIVEEYYNSSTTKIFSPLFSNKIEEAHPVRFSIDKNSLYKSGINVPNMSYQDIYYLYNMYAKSAHYHPEVSDRGEIQLLQESIKKLEQSKKDGYEKYDVNKYISNKISSITDNKEKNNLIWAWNTIKRLKLPLQNPSWIAIAWPQQGSHSLNLDGSMPGDNQKIDELSKLTFCDPETEQKMVWLNGKMQVANSGVKLPVTPHTTLIEIIGTKPSSGKHNKRVEYIRELLKERIRLFARSSGKKREQHFQEATKIKSLLSVYEEIRNNLATVDHRDKNSFFYLYDKICEFYFEYNRERYGDGIMIRFSAMAMDKDGNKYISPYTDWVRGQDNRPFMPVALHDDLREVVISVHYAYGTEIPQLARTSLPGNSSFVLNPIILNKIIQKAQQKGLKKLTINNDFIQEKEIPIEEMMDFFNKMSKGNVLVYRINKNESSGTANIVWYAGLRSFQDRHKDKTTRIVYNDDGSTSQITGYGKSRISIGTSSVSENFKYKLREFLGSGNSRGNISVPDWNDVYVSENFMDVYQYANEVYGLDYDSNKIQSMASQKIKTISPDIIKEMSTFEENKVKSEIAKIEDGGQQIIITENTQKLIKEIIVEVASENIVPDDASVEIIEEKTPSQTLTQTQYQPTDQDREDLKTNEFANSMFGGIAISDPQQIENLKRQGYELEKSGPLYKVIKFPSWDQKIKEKV